MGFRVYRVLGGLGVRLVQSGESLHLMFHNIRLAEPEGTSEDLLSVACMTEYDRPRRLAVSQNATESHVASLGKGAGMKRLPLKASMRPTGNNVSTNSRDYNSTLQGTPPGFKELIKTI